MAIVKWTVSPWSGPDRQDYSHETEHFYMHARGRGRDAKVTSYLIYFDSKEEALEYIRQREENKAEQKRVDQIERHAVELLEALENCEMRLTAMVGMSDLCANEIQASIDIARTAIAKAKGTE